MYAALWRVLPGSTALKILQCLVLALAIVAVLFLWVFPAIAPLMTINDASRGTSP